MQSMADTEISKESYLWNN